LTVGRYVPEGKYFIIILSHIVRDIQDIQSKKALIAQQTEVVEERSESNVEEPSSASFTGKTTECVDEKTDKPLSRGIEM